MNSTPARLLVPLVVWLLFYTAACADDQQGPAIPRADLNKIRMAAPSKSPALPKKTRKLLVFSRLTGYRHESVPWGARAFRILGEKSGAYSALLSDDPAMFDRNRLEQFDAVLFNNNCGNPMQDPARRKNFLDFVAGGAGCFASTSRRNRYTLAGDPRKQAG